MLLSGDYDRLSHVLVMVGQVLGWVRLLYLSGVMGWMSSPMLGASRPITHFPRTPCNYTFKFANGSENDSIAYKLQHEEIWGIK
jgi:hypothetical protein